MSPLNFKTQLHVVLVFVTVLLTVSTVFAQGATDTFTPRSGPAGTRVFVTCRTSDEAARIQGGENISLNADGTTILAIPDDLPVDEAYPIFCVDTGSERNDVGSPPRDIGEFVVTNCPIGARAINNLEVQPLASYLTVQRIDGEAIGIDRSGNYVFSAIITEDLGYRLRINIRSQNSATLLTYLRELKIDFRARTIGNPERLRSCDFDPRLNLGSTPNSSIPNNTDIDVEIIALTPSVSDPEFVAANPLLLRFLIDPSITYNDFHSYRPISADMMTVGFNVSAGSALLVAWNDRGYLDTIFGTPDSDLTKLQLSNNAAVETDYAAYVQGQSSGSSIYTLRGAFITSACNPETTSCGLPDYQSLRLAQGGIGITTDSREMNEGEIEVEGYCEDQGREVSQDYNHWYCDGEPLVQSDFLEICRLTYQRNAQYAGVTFIVLPDGNSSTPAFNWRCFVPVN